MSTASNSVLQVTSFSGSSSINAALDRADQRTARNPEHTKSSLLETIAGRRGSLRAILSQVEAVAGTNTTVLKTGESRMGTENLGELEKLISAEADGRRIVLDLRDLTLVDRDAVSFLQRCEADSITLKNCPAYIRRWLTGEGR
jgi:DNA-binding NtrC family response regulator